MKAIDTKIIKVTEEAIDEAGICEAGRIIREGGLVAFPTETVYGLGGDAFNPESSRKIYAAKGRPSDNPLIVHIADMDDLYQVAESVSDTALLIANKYWPGPLTMIFKKKPAVPTETTGGLETVAVRFPSHPVAKEFIKAAGGFVAAPSANISGRPSPTEAKYVVEDMDGRIEMIIDGGSCQIGLESTIIDMTGDKPVILRPGYITPKDLEALVDSVDIDRTILDDQSGLAPKAPGMKYKHYAPKAELTIVRGKNQNVINFINAEANKAKAEGIRCGVIATRENISLYEGDSIKNVGSRNDEEAIARNLFRILREFDDEDIDVIYTEGFGNEGLSMATMNRLLKAAGHKEVNV